MTGLSLFFLFDLESEEWHNLKVILAFHSDLQLHTKHKDKIFWAYKTLTNKGNVIHTPCLSKPCQAPGAFRGEDRLAEQHFEWLSQLSCYSCQNGV